MVKKKKNLSIQQERLPTVKYELVPTRLILPLHFLCYETLIYNMYKNKLCPTHYSKVRDPHDKRAIKNLKTTVLRKL